MNASAHPPKIALHPGSGSERKNWPLGHWQLFLAQAVSRTDGKFLFISGEADTVRAEKLAPILPASRTEFARQLPLLDLAHKMSACSFFIGHDSGITHLASALGLPGLVLWGGSNLQVWRPRGDGLKVLQSPGGLAGLSVDQVWTEWIAAMRKLRLCADA